MPLLSLATALAGMLFATLACSLPRHARLTWVHPICMAAASLALLTHLVALLGAQSVVTSLPLGLPGIGLRFRLDPLSALFGVIVNLGILACSYYALGLRQQGGLSARVEPFYPLFAAAMNLVLLCDDAFGFLFFWELMSVSSWIMVLARHEDPESRHAAHTYLVMASIGTLALLFAFGGLAGTAGGYAFDSMREHAQAPWLYALVLCAVIIGSGSKAGLMPLHAWLPLAHPAAPSHVSALMSGVMTKVAVYALIRIVFDLMAAPLWWWALPLIVLGAATAVGGVLHALMDNDLKRVLAYSTVENMGVVFLGLGLALAFEASGLTAAAALSMAAALLHAVNHSWFKSLLFLAAGAVVHTTGRRDFDALGGLIQRMPGTAAVALVGVLAIAALPPLNGFVSEWLLFQAVLAGGLLPEPVLRLLIPATGALLALSAALAAACFVRFFGATFLGRPRSTMAAHAHDPARTQLLAMTMLAALCIAGGLLGSFTVQALTPILNQLLGSGVPGAGSGPTPFSLVAFDPARSTYDAVVIAGFALGSGILTMLAVHRISERRSRRAPAWDCGFAEDSPLTQYSASSFAQPIRRVYGSSIFTAREHIHMPSPGDPGPARLEVSSRDHIWQWLYQAPSAAVLWLSQRLNTLAFLSIRRYLVLMFVSLIILLLVSAVQIR
ncbi:MAG: hydrogenase 4 subunit B [Gammaproteobacteria bacterium]|nr:hydrogenase 4 subunit B [Gammaproteobacteria bacterium]